MGGLSISLSSISRCFEAVIPNVLVTAAPEGTINIINISHVYLVDERHVAVSRQFFLKTMANLVANPFARAAVTDPATLEAYRLGLRFEREDTTGPVFDAMATRLEAVASMTGMKGVFRLQSVLIFEVLDVEQIPDVVSGHAAPLPRSAVAAIDALAQLRVLRRLSDCVRTAPDADSLMGELLATLDDAVGFRHSMILLLDETGNRLYAVASRGYPASGVGAEVAVGEGIIGTVAARRRLLRVSDMDRLVRYGRAMQDGSARDEVVLPGLADVRSQLALPLMVKDELVGVLAVESRDAMAFSESDEEFLYVVASHAAQGLKELLSVESESAEPIAPAAAATRAGGPTRRFVFYPADDCVFVDGQYLVRNVPGRILWKLLKAHLAGQSEFLNRELRLDPHLKLPQLRDNLESRLILLRKRLAEKVPEVVMRPVARGRFALDVGCTVELSERA